MTQTIDVDWLSELLASASLAKIEDQKQIPYSVETYQSAKTISLELRCVFLTKNRYKQSAIDEALQNAKLIIDAIHFGISASLFSLSIDPSQASGALHVISDNYARSCEQLIQKNLFSEEEAKDFFEYCRYLIADAGDFQEATGCEIQT